MKKFIAIFIAAITVLCSLVFTSSAATANSVWETEPNDSYVTADVLDINGVIGAVCSSSSDEDYFVIESIENGKVNLFFNTIYVNDSMYDVYWLVKIIVESGGVYTTHSERYVYASSDKYSGTANIELTSLGVETGNKYYVIVKGQAEGLSCSYPVDVEYSISSTFTKNSIIDIADPDITDTIKDSVSGIKNVFEGVDWSGTISTFMSKFLSVFQTLIPYFKQFINTIIGAM